jgi:hypothetical protein
MRSGLLFFCILSGLLCSSQADVRPENPTVVPQDSVGLILLYDCLPQFSFFTPSDSCLVKSRIASLQMNTLNKDLYFYTILLFSLLLVLVFINSRDMVSNSIASISSLQKTIQFSRTEKQSNGLYFVLYFILSVFSLALAGQYIITEIYGLNYSFFSIFLLVAVTFFIDYLSSYLYLLFTSNYRTIDMIQTVILTFPVLLSFILWPVLFFIILSSFATAKVFFIILCIVLGLILLLKEFRTLQILWLEKIDIFSFHFFAYLCSFKFLPLFLVVKVFF